MRAPRASRHPAHLLGVEGLQGLRDVLEVGPRHLFAQLLHQLLEVLPGLARDELVVLQAAHPPAQVVGQEVEGEPPLGGHPLGDLGPALVARVPGLLLEVVDGAPLLVEDVLQALGHPGHLRVGVPLGEQLLSAPAQLLEHVAQPGDLATVGGPHPAPEQPPDGVVEAPPGEQVVGQPGQQVVGVEVGEVLAPVPAPVVVAGGHRLRLR